MPRLIANFKAGKMKLVNKQLVAETEKGVLEILESSEGLYTFSWSSRDSAAVAVAQEVKGGQAELVQIPNPTDRIFWLKCKDKKIPKFFFWLQDASTENDEKNIESIRAALRIPYVTPPPPSSPQEPGAVQLSDLQQIMNLMGNPAPQEPQAMARGPTLSQVLNPRSLESFIINMSEEDETRLREFLPEGHSTKQDVINLLHSPQFLQALNRFDGVLHSDNLPSIFYQCGLEWTPNVLQSPPVVSFFRALQQKVNKDKNKE